MTTEDDFHAALDANPGDGLARLALADWLDENAGDVPCPKCMGTGSHALNPYDLAHRYGVGTATRILEAARCGICHGTGAVPDGRRERAAGYRWLAEAGHVPEHAAPLGPPEWTWWDAESYEQTGPAYLPRAVMRAVWEAAPDDRRDSYHHAWTEHTTRREADDAAALAFGRLPADVQARILAGVTAR